MPYHAFISYSHHADSILAPVIQDSLRRIANPWYRRRSMRIFRDHSNLGTSPGLWSAIESELQESEFLLLMASPQASQSLWVQKEVEWWITHRSAQTVLILLTDGHIAWNAAQQDFDWRVTTALPRCLSQVFVEEPLYTDFRWARTVEHVSLRHARFRGAILEVAATVLHRPKDELDGEDVRRQRSAIRLAWSAVTVLVILLVLAIGAAVVAVQQTHLATERLAAVCKALDEAQVLSDVANHGSVYYFHNEYAEIAEQCQTVSYEAWH